MATIALLLIALWIGVAAVLRSVVHARRTGRVATPPPVPRRSPRAVARVFSSVGVLLIVAAPVAEILGLRPIGPLDHAPVRWLGVVMSLAGMGGLWLAQSSMGDAWLPDVDPETPTPLVTTGPFAVVRNPVLLATLISVVGIGLVVPNVLAAAAIVAVFIGLEVQVRLVEEPHLERTHGEAYRDYQRRVGRFLPWVGRRA